MEHLTDEQIEQGIVDPIVVLVNQSLSQIPGDKADLVISKLKERFAQLDSNQELDVKAIVHAALTIGKTAAEATPTKKDDAVINGLLVAEGILLGTSGGGLLGNIIAFGKSIKEAKKAS